MVAFIETATKTSSPSPVFTPYSRVDGWMEQLFRIGCNVSSRHLLSFRTAKCTWLSTTSPSTCSTPTLPPCSRLGLKLSSSLLDTPPSFRCLIKGSINPSSSTSGRKAWHSCFATLKVQSPLDKTSHYGLRSHGTKYNLPPF